jgi:hypothetical protein
MDNVEDVLDHWAKDCDFNEANILGEIARIPQLHAKYLRFLNDHKKESFKAKLRYDKMKEIRTSYYLGHLDQESLETYGWEQFDLRISKSSLEGYLNSDKLLTKLLQTKTFHDIAVSSCEHIMAEIRSRSFQMKSYVEYQKFLSGA